MFKLFQHKGFVQIFWLFMSLYLLNISVDSPDYFSNSISEDLSFNDQESIVEIVVEQVLGYENAIKEYDDNDTEEHNGKVQLKVDWFSKPIYSGIFSSSNLEANKDAFYSPKLKLSLGYFQTDTPPPKA